MTARATNSVNIPKWIKTLFKAGIYYVLIGILLPLVISIGAFFWCSVEPQRFGATPLAPKPDCTKWFSYYPKLIKSAATWPIIFVQIFAAALDEEV